MRIRELFILITFILLTSNLVCKAASEETEENKQGEDTENLAGLASPVVVGAICLGAFVFLCVVTVVVCECKKCRKCCRREKPEVEKGVPSEEVYVDPPKTEVVVNIPEQPSLHGSFTCSHCSGSPPGTPKSSSWSLLSLFSLPLVSKREALSCPESETSLKSEEEICTQSPPLSPVSVLSLTNVSTGSPISLSAISLTFEPEDLASVPETSRPNFSETPTDHCALKESTVPLANSSHSYIPDHSQSSPSAKPVTSNEPSSERLSFFQGVTRTVRSLVTNNSTSSTESCKTPVAPMDDDVILNIDEDDVHEGGMQKAIDNVVIDIVSNEDENNTLLVTGNDDGPPGALPIASKGHSPAGLEDDATSVSSPILGEKKRVIDLKNKERRRLIKQQTQHTNCSLNESILCAKAIIMDEMDTSRTTVFHSTLNPFAKPFVPAAFKDEYSTQTSTAQCPVLTVIGEGKNEENTFWNSRSSKTAENQEEAKFTRQKRIPNKHRPDRALYIPPVKASWQNYQQK